MTKWDKLLIVFVLVASLLGLYYVKGIASNNSTKYILIEVDGEQYKKISFGNNMIGETIEVKTEYGYNKLEIGDGRVRIIEADCPDKLDVKQGWISNPGQVIVCLPNRLVVEIITENNEDKELDYMSY
ncbi:NusG domain II-containing protein [Thermohalobacter berrensis]|uniref:Uncharacterized protein n=1 Tax=Thermohalobacter berrensis TaxID=99594 RepID=A0A419T6Y4_9FIRM|nr:NusG domain II-containing protein [Thermohalobacter berrensis]RKD33196.1 hypothetical protein BET03_09790 [Thermohalobacter berrensis]